MSGKKSYYNLIKIKNKEVIFLKDSFFIFIYLYQLMISINLAYNKLNTLDK